jgi:hypothetical protein
MGRPRILDAKIMSKIATKVRKGGPAVSGMVSKMAAKHSISAEAALILLAKKHGIGTATYQRSLDATKQAEVRDALPGIFASGERGSNNKDKRKGAGIPGLTGKPLRLYTPELRVTNPAASTRFNSIVAQVRKPVQIQIKTLPEKALTACTRLC